MHEHTVTQEQAMLLPDSVRMNPAPKQVKDYPLFNFLYPLIQPLREELMYLKVEANGEFSLLVWVQRSF